MTSPLVRIEGKALEVIAERPEHVMVLAVDVVGNGTPNGHQLGTRGSPAESSREEWTSR